MSSSFPALPAGTKRIFGMSGDTEMVIVLDQPQSTWIPTENNPRRRRGCFWSRLHSLCVALVGSRSTLVRRKWDTAGATTSGEVKWTWWSPGTVTTECCSRKREGGVTCQCAHSAIAKAIITQTHVSVVQTLEKHRGEFFLVIFGKFCLDASVRSGRRSLKHIFECRADTMM